MKKLLSTSILICALGPAAAEACKMQPLAASLVKTEAALKHLETSGLESQSELKSVSFSGGKVHVELIADIQTGDDSTACTAYDYTVTIGADCSTRIATEEGPLECENPVTED